jgi:hypothetical protein
VHFDDFQGTPKSLNFNILVEKHNLPILLISAEKDDNLK